MKNLGIAIVSAVLMCGCSATKPATTAPQPQPISLAEQWTFTVANLPAPPTGWTLQSQTVLLTQTMPVGPCSTDFTNLMNPNTMPLPTAGFNACAFLGNIPLPTGPSNWLETVALGTPTTELYPGEAVYYVLQFASADGFTNMVLGGKGTFTATTTVQGTTTHFNYQISGPIGCLTINNSMSAACTAWQTTLTAKAN